MLVIKLLMLNRYINRYYSYYVGKIICWYLNLNMILSQLFRTIFFFVIQGFCYIIYASNDTRPSCRETQHEEHILIWYNKVTTNWYIALHKYGTFGLLDIRRLFYWHHSSLARWWITQSLFSILLLSTNSCKNREYFYWALTLPSVIVISNLGFASRFATESWVDMWCTPCRQFCRLLWL